MLIFSWCRGVSLNTTDSVYTDCMYSAIQIMKICYGLINHCKLQEQAILKIIQVHTLLFLISGRKSSKLLKSKFYFCPSLVCSFKPRNSNLDEHDCAIFFEKWWWNIYWILLFFSSIVWLSGTLLYILCVVALFKVISTLNHPVDTQHSQINTTTSL